MTYIFYESDDFRTYIQSPAAKEDIKNKFVYQQTWKNANFEHLDFTNNKIHFIQLPSWLGQSTTLTKSPYDLVPLIFNEDFVFMGQQYKANTPALVPAIFLYSLWVHETEAAKFDVAFTALETIGYIYGVGGLVRAIRTADGALVVFRAIQLVDLGTHSYIAHIRDESKLTQAEKDAAKEWIDAFYVCSFALMLNSLHVETFEINRNTVATKGNYLRELKDANGAYKYSDEVRELIRKTMLACQEAGTGCFVKSTPISAEFEMLPIEKITTNSKVWSWDIEKKERILQKVSNVFVRSTKQLVHIFVGKEKISTTPEHPFYVPQDEELYASKENIINTDSKKAAWIDAKNLKKGTKVFLFSSLLASIDSVYTQDTICTVYNFEVEGTHNYFVGKDKVLVHNNACEVVEEYIKTTARYFENFRNHKSFLGIFDMTEDEIKFLQGLKSQADIAKGKNGALLELIGLDTKNKNFVAISGEGQFNSTKIGKDYVDVPFSSEIGYKSETCDFYGNIAPKDKNGNITLVDNLFLSRYADSERKALWAAHQEIVERYGSIAKNIRFQVILSTEKFPCISCSKIIFEEFLNFHKGASIIIKTGCK